MSDFNNQYQKTAQEHGEGTSCGMIVNLDCVLLGKEVSSSPAQGDDSAGTVAPAAQRDLTLHRLTAQTSLHFL